MGGTIEDRQFKSLTEDANSLDARRVVMSLLTGAIGTFGVDFDHIAYDFNTSKKMILRLRLGGGGGTLHKTVTFTFVEDTLFTPSTVAIA